MRQRELLVYLIDALHKADGLDPAIEWSRIVMLVEDDLDRMVGELRLLVD